MQKQKELSVGSHLLAMAIYAKASAIKTLRYLGYPYGPLKRLELRMKPKTTYTGYVLYY
jgi:hypothetical protein